MTVAGSAVDLLFLPTWAALAVYLLTIPLGLLVGALALRGLGRSDRTAARLLAVGLVLLTTVDALLGLTVGVGSVTVIERVPGIVREVVQLLGLCCILYAIYAPTRRVGDDRSAGVRSETDGLDAVRGAPDSETEPTDSGGDDR
jgi:hypothetical protein